MKTFILFVILLECAASIVTGGSIFAAELPNFLVILCDDLGYGDLGCFGHKNIESPQLDKLASQVMRFTDCYATRGQKVEHIVTMHSLPPP